MTTEVGIYLRISADPEGRELGVTRQEHDCRRLAEQRGWDITQVYTENDISAFKQTRSEHQLSAKIM